MSKVCIYRKAKSAALATAVTALALGDQALGQGTLLADNGLLTFEPPAIDYAATCEPRAVSTVELGQDWTLWDGVDTPGTTGERTSEDLFAIAREYLSGSARVKANPAVALRLLKAVDARSDYRRPTLHYYLGRAYFNVGGPDNVAASEENYLRAADGGHVKAALSLGRFYGGQGPVSRRNIADAERFLLRASAAGDAEAQIELAKLFARDPARTRDDKAFQAVTAVGGLIAAVERGECQYLGDVAALYLEGTLVQQNVPLALRWYETQLPFDADGRLASRLGRLYASRLIPQPDFQKAYDYIEQAAEKGRVTEMAILGRALVTGVGRQKDMPRGEAMLVAARDAGSQTANGVLARHWLGRFGAEPNLPQAEQALRAMIVAPTDGAPTSGPTIDLAELLLADGFAGPRAKEALELLRPWAEKANGDASVMVANILAASAITATQWNEVWRYRRLAAQLGEYAGARALSERYRCTAKSAKDIARADRWREKAAFLRSAGSMYDLAKALIETESPEERARGIMLMGHAALMGSDTAIAYVLAAHERDRLEMIEPTFEASTVTAVKQFAEALDGQVKRKWQLALPKQLHDIANDDATRTTAIEEMDRQIVLGWSEALANKAKLLRDAGAPDAQMDAEVDALYAQAADAGLARAQRHMAEQMLKDPAADLTEAQALFAQAAAKGDTKARILAIDLNTNDAFDKLNTIRLSAEACTPDQMIALARAFARLEQPRADVAANDLITSARFVAGQDPDALLSIAKAANDGVGGNMDAQGVLELLFTATEAG
ncbi:MAG: hypothetical protein AAF737_03380, partial [Pseudomonadota bacterium]